MAFLRFSEVRAAARSALRPLQKSASTLLKEERSLAPADAKFAVFLSHSSQDADDILGVKRLIEAEGLTVYVDWITDSALDRNKVDGNTAKLLRLRMNNSSNLIYADSATAEDSKWMPWELGYFDGIRPSHIFVLPLVTSVDSEYKGREYLDLYPKAEAIKDLYGRTRLGFEDVNDGQQRRTIMLKEAAWGPGIDLS